MKKYIPLTIGLLAVALLLAFVVGQGRAQQASPDSERTTAPEAPAVSSNYIPVQGRLTDASGNPLNGNYTLIFRLYDVSTGGTALCEDTRTVSVEGGLFNAYMGASDCPIDGRQLYLGVQVETDPEMTPRRYIDNVPYAWGLRPGAEVRGALDDDPILYVYNTGTGVGLWASSNTNEGVHGASGTGTGVFGYSITGIGVYADSFDGVAIAAAGTGVITSTAQSSLWISGNGVRPYHQNDTTIIDMDTIGGAKIYSGAIVANKNVMLPITIPGVLYGQNVKVTGMEIHWVASAGLEGISAVLLRRQTGVCGTSACYDTILLDPTDYVCAMGENPTGCVESFDLTTNNVLNDEYGVLYLTIEISFASSTDWIEIGGVKLTLEHDN